MKRILSLILSLTLMTTVFVLCTSTVSAQESQTPQAAIAQYADKATVLISKADFEKATDIVRMYSSEIEYSEENTDKLFKI